MSVVESSGAVKHAVISASSSGDNTLVAAVTGKIIRVLAYNIVAAGTVSVTFESDGASSDTALTGALPMAANERIEGVFNPCGHFQTLAGEALLASLSGAVAITGHMTYQEIG